MYTSLPPVSAYLPYHLPTSACLSVYTSFPSLCLPSLPPAHLCLSVYTFSPSLCLPSLPPVYLYLSVCVYLSTLSLLAFPTTCLPPSVCLSNCVYLSLSASPTSLPPSLLASCLSLCLSASVCIPLCPLSACLPYHLPPTSVCQQKVNSAWYKDNKHWSKWQNKQCWSSVNRKEIMLV